MTWFLRENDVLSLNLASRSALSSSVCVSPACFQTSMPLKWNCGSTVFALAPDPSGAQAATRLTPEAFLLQPVFLPQHFTLTSKTNNQHLNWLMAVWNLDEPGVLETQCASVLLELKQNHMAASKGLLFLVLCSETPNNTAWSNLWNRSSQATFAGFQITFVFCWVVSCCLQRWDPDLGHFHTPTRKTKSDDDCKCSWNMNMFKDTVKDAVLLSFAEVRPTFGPEEQYISGVCA